MLEREYRSKGESAGRNRLDISAYFLSKCGKTSEMLSIYETRAVDISWLEGEGNIAQPARPKKGELGALGSAPDYLNSHWVS